MKYTVNGNNDYNFGVVKEVLKRRGVEDVDLFLNLSDEVLEPLENYDNMQEGFELLITHIEKENHIHILIDTDVDGLTSAAHLFLYIDDICKDLGRNPKVTYHINEGKLHGIDPDDRKITKSIDLLVVPDAGSSDKEAIEEMYKRGKEVLIIDHHNLEEENTLTTEAVLINPQSSKKVKNKNISGAGVVHKFCQYVDSKLSVNHADKYLDLVALGNIADMIDLREPETKYLIDKGLSNVNNEFIQALMDANAFMMQGHLTPTTIGWNIAPSLNATIRVGKPKERLDMFEALIGVERFEHYKTKTVDEMQSLQTTMARVCGNVKGRQDRAVKKSLEEIMDVVKRGRLDENKILIVDVTGILDKNYTGLVANKLASSFKRPILLLQEWVDDSVTEDGKKSKKTFGGSGRNYDRHTIKDLQVYLQDTGLFDMVAGHDNAFGVRIDADKIPKLIEMANKDLVDAVQETKHVVDFEIPMHKLTPSLIKEVADARGLWGKGIREPLFAITDIRVSSKDVELHGTRGKTIRFKKKDITFESRFANEDKYNNFILKSRVGMNLTKDLNYTIIGKFKMGEYNDKEFPVVEIVTYDVREEDLIVF